MNDKNFTISAARGIAIILVVYGHVIQRSMAPWGADFFLNPAFKTVYTFHMPLFFFLSGYTLCYSLSRRNLRGAFQARCRTLLVPFLSWGVLGVCTFYLLGVFGQGGAGAFNFPQALLNDLLLKPAIWFLFSLFACSAMMLGSIRLAKRAGWIAYVLVYLAVLLIPCNEYFALYYIKWFYPFYAAGYGAHTAGLKVPEGRWSSFIFAGALAVFLLLTQHWARTDYIYIHQMRFLSADYAGELGRMGYRYLTGFAGIMAVLFIAASCAKIKWLRVLDTAGIYSLDIYLIQRYVVEGAFPLAVKHLRIQFDFHSPFFLYMYAPAMAVVFTGICVSATTLFIRKSRFLAKVLFGRG